MAIGRFDATVPESQPITVLCSIPQILGRLTPHYANQSDPLAPHHSVDSQPLPETLMAVSSAFVYYQYFMPLWSAFEDKRKHF
jgi:hypothetical protein